MNTIDYSKQILKELQYGGNSKSNQKEISASMVGSDIQQALLRYKYGIIPSDSVGQAEIGSLVHLGLNNIDFGEKVNREYNIKMLYKDWIVSGTIDRIDLENNMITDTKVTKTYTIQSVENDAMHSYRLQVNLYRILAERKFNCKFNMQLEVFDKQGGYNYRKGEKIPDLVYVPIEQIDDKIIYDRIDEIIAFVEAGSEKQCDDVWVRKIGGKAIPSRCELYCSYKQVCSAYNPKPSTVITGWDL